RNDSKSTVIITSRSREDWLGEVGRLNVGGLNRAEAAEYAGYLLVSIPAAQQGRDQRAFGELLERLDGHPLAIRLTVPRMETDDPASLLDGLRGVSPLSGGDMTLLGGRSAKGRHSSLEACIAYSFCHLSEQSRQLIPAISVLRDNFADLNLLT